MPERHPYETRYGNALAQKEGRPNSSGVTRRGWLAEQGFGRRTVSTGPVTMSNGARDFLLKQLDSRVQFIMRIGVKQLRSQLAGQIPFRARALVHVHFVRYCALQCLAVNALRG